MNTPYTIIKELKANFSNIFEAKEQQIKGIYKDESDKPYKGDNHFYDSIRDIKEPLSMTLRIPAYLKHELRDGDICELSGYLEQYTPRNETKIELRFKVREILNRSYVAPNITEGEKNSILDARYSQDKYPVDEIILNLLEKGISPKIALITGKSATTGGDVDRTLGAEKARYFFKTEKININSSIEIISKLIELDRLPENDKFNVIAIYRGGETGLEVFDDLDMAKAVLDLKTPFITAVGHAVNRPFIEIIADKSFITPTALGYYLKEMVSIASTRNWQKKKFDDKEKQYKKKVDELNEQLSNNRRSIQSFDGLKNQITSLSEEVNRSVKFLQENFKRNPDKNSETVVISLIFGMVIGVGMTLGFPYIYNRYINYQPDNLPTETINISNNSNINSNVSEVSNSKQQLNKGKIK